MGRPEEEEEVWNKQLNNEVFQFILFFNNNTLETLSCDSKHILRTHSSAFFCLMFLQHPDEYAMKNVFDI